MYSWYFNIEVHEYPLVAQYCVMPLPVIRCQFVVSAVVPPVMRGGSLECFPLVIEVEVERVAVVVGSLVGPLADVDIGVERVVVGSIGRVTTSDRTF